MTHREHDKPVPVPEHACDCDKCGRTCDCDHCECLDCTCARCGHN